MPAPVISSALPSAGVAGVTVSIVGVNFTGATVVKFGGVNATSFVVNSDTSISAIVPVTTTGVILVTASGSGTSAFNFIILQVIEKILSRPATITVDSKPQYELMYGILGTEDDLAARLALEATFPASIAGLYFQRYRIEYKGGLAWDAVVSYEILLLNTFSFDTTGGKFKLFNSFASAYYPRPGQDAIDYFHAIEVSKEEVKGVEILAPQFSFTYERLLQAPIDSTYVQLLYQLTGRVNIDTITLVIQGMTFVFNPGELLFHGATGAQKSPNWFDIIMKFDASPNQLDLIFPSANALNLIGTGVKAVNIITNIVPGTAGCVIGQLVTGAPTIPNGTTITAVGGGGFDLTLSNPLANDAVDFPFLVNVNAPIIVDKRGWDYLWVLYEDVEDAKFALTRRPRQVNVEQVYPYAELAGLFT